VYLIHRRDTFRGAKTTLDKIKKNEKIEVITNNEITKIKGNEKLESIVLKDNKELLIDGLFIAIGNEPETEIFKGQVELTEGGYIKTNKNLETNLKMVYGAGDVVDKKLRQVVTAQNDGAIAVNEIIERL
jgi:thioredoxin reductase (NADPH)